MKKRTLKDAVAEKKADKLAPLAVATPTPTTPPTEFATEAPKSPPAASRPEAAPNPAKPEKTPQPAPGSGKNSKTRRNCCASKRGQNIPHLPECQTLKSAGAKRPDLSSDHTANTDA